MPNLNDKVPIKQKKKKCIGSILVSKEYIWKSYLIGIIIHKNRSSMYKTNFVEEKF